MLIMISSSRKMNRFIFVYKNCLLFYLITSINIQINRYLIKSSTLLSSDVNNIPAAAMYSDTKLDDYNSVLTDSNFNILINANNSNIKRVELENNQNTFSFFSSITSQIMLNYLISKNSIELKSTNLKCDQAIDLFIYNQTSFNDKYVISHTFLSCNNYNSIYNYESELTTQTTLSNLNNNNNTYSINLNKIKFISLSPVSNQLFQMLSILLNSLNYTKYGIIFSESSNNFYYNMAWDILYKFYEIDTKKSSYFSTLSKVDFKKLNNSNTKSIKRFLFGF